MPTNTGQNAASSTAPSTRAWMPLETSPAAGDAAAFARLTPSAGLCSSGIAIIVIILPPAVGAEIVIRQHGTEQRQAIFLDELVSLHRGFALRDAGPQD